MDINTKLNTIISYLTHLRVYRDPQRVRTDTTDLFRFFPNLQPYYGANRIGNLIYLKGTIPIKYQQFIYHIPIIAWLPENYPFAPPQIILDPTPEMEIVKGHPHVNENGLCLHHYLSHWTWSSNISQAVKYLCDTYSAAPPLVTKKKVETNIPNTSPPPYPMQQQQQQQPQQQQLQQQPQNTSWSNMNMNMNQPPPTYAESMGVQQQQQQNTPPSQSPSGIPIVNKPATPPQTTAVSASPVSISPGAAAAAASMALAAQKKNERDEVLQNCTEKLQEIISSFYDTTSKEIENYIAHNATLEEQSIKLTQEEEILKSDMDVFEKLIVSTTEKIEQIDKWIKENEKDEKDLDIDALSAPKDALQKQLLSLVSEDMTIEDALYYLDKALHLNRITLDEYLKNIRTLSREQFMIRATVRKVQQQIQLNLMVIQQHHQQQHVL
ncbi:tumor susceptibility gene 101 protein [Heterostelium album PN500]|uniref:Tumor susceptibility gene 101 protein n=1 Tax=Heterostelium pallidum (strain ATCC 26659 / Pp 5 / PN500) TaxID=670386 RepID=D3AYD3_HETP5|nr:tumor susceptibility gene 101 protein [Heterostelium album PN500]EFA85960.1 tumor susceptibility gene 101 protein [Heterostelium album PN500]|eukprot:XP_020438066.1 tumor susceptibility gene 101 protein [Heterostelium album PN500]